MFVSFQNGILTKNQIFKSHRVTSLCTAIKLSASWNVPILPLSLSMPNSKSLYNLHKWPIKMNKCIQAVWIAGHLKENLLETLWGYLSSCECTYMNRGECGWSCKAFVVQTIAISAGRDTPVSIRSSPQCWWCFFFRPLRVEKVEKKKSNIIRRFRIENLQFSLLIQQPTKKFLIFFKLTGHPVTSSHITRHLFWIEVTALFLHSSGTFVVDILECNIFDAIIMTHVDIFSIILKRKISENDILGGSVGWSSPFRECRKPSQPPRYSSLLQSAFSLFVYLRNIEVSLWEIFPPSQIFLFFFFNSQMIKSGFKSCHWKDIRVNTRFLFKVLFKQWVEPKFFSGPDKLRCWGGEEGWVGVEGGGCGGVEGNTIIKRGWRHLSRAVITIARSLSSGETLVW